MWVAIWMPSPAPAPGHPLLRALQQGPKGMSPGSHPSPHFPTSAHGGALCPSLLPFSLGGSELLPGASGAPLCVLFPWGESS